MTKETIIGNTKKIEDIVSKYHDLVGEASISLKQEHSVDSPEILSKLLENMENKDRLLQIGIVGRVKAGKSSLLNALLFEGQIVLPKAATPLTAALTILSYGEEVSAEVEFFTNEDIGNIKKNADIYKNKLDKSITEKISKMKSHNKSISDADIRIKAHRQAILELNENFEISAAYDQYNRIQNAGVNVNELRAKKIINFNSIEDLGPKLLQFVGAEGKYMPLTKSVHIKLPQENLKDIQIIDTPGINDSVQSREERTRELLKYCDVIFIVSPSGNFLSKQDIDLMDRITSKEGIRELYVVVSQVDTQLFNSEYKIYNSDLIQILDVITANLGDYLSSTLSRLKKDNPEVGNTFDQLIKDGSGKVLHSSGICQTIKLQFNKREKWDPGIKMVWENLTEEYPNHFSDDDETISLSNLSLLANISAIKEIVSSVRDKKDKILNNRKEDTIKDKNNSLVKYYDGLVSFTQNQADKINNSSIEKIKKQKENLDKTQKKASDALNNEYYDLIKEMEINIDNTLKQVLNSYYKESRKSVDEAEDTTTESYTIDNGAGFLGWRSILGQRYKTSTREVASVRTGAVASNLENLTTEIESVISSESKKYILEWRKNLYLRLIKVLRNNVDDDDLDIDIIRSTIRDVLNNVKYPEIEYNGSLPEELKAKGTLTGSGVEEYVDEARSYINKLKKRVNRDIKNYIKFLVDSLNGITPSTQIFDSYKEKINQLEEQIKLKEITLERFSKLQDELKMSKIK